MASGPPLVSRAEPSLEEDGGEERSESDVSEDEDEDEERSEGDMALEEEILAGVRGAQDPMVSKHRLPHTSGLLSAETHARCC